MFANSEAESRVVNVLVDTADTGTTASLDAYVTIFTPPGVPRVPHDVVLNAVLHTVTHSGDGVIDVRRAT